MHLVVAHAWRHHITTGLHTAVPRVRRILIFLLFFRGISMAFAWSRETSCWIMLSYHEMEAGASGLCYKKTCIFLHILHNCLPGDCDGPGMVRLDFCGGGSQAYTNPGPLRPIFQQPVLPWGEVPKYAIITVRVGGIIGNMYGAAKSSAHQIIRINGRGRSAGTGDRDGTGARLPAKRRHSQAPGV